MGQANQKAENRNKAQKAKQEASDDAVYCLCEGKDDGSPMICCDVCNDWLHFACLDLDEEGVRCVKLQSGFVCPRHKDNDSLKKKAKLEKEVLMKKMSKKEKASFFRKSKFLFY